MTKRIACILAALAVFALCLSACGGGGTASTRQADNKAYVWFNGSTEDVVAFVDGQGPIFLEDFTSGNKKEVHFEIEPGKHTIRLERNSIVIVERTVLIGNGMVKEIEVP